MRYNFLAVADTDLNAVVLDGISLADLQAMPFVVSIEPDPIVTVATVDWGLDRLDQENLPLSNSYTPLIDACGVDVYILDTGLDTTHYEFQDLSNSGVNRTVMNVYNKYGDLLPNTDGHGHGTHCAGTVGGRSVGVAPCANVYSLKVLSDTGSGSGADVIDALDFVKLRHMSNPSAKSIVSLSLGAACNNNDCSTDALNLKIQELANVGIPAAIAAGNSAVSASTFSPASALDGITVAASTSTDSRASYSNYGSVIDIYAPGDNIGSACSSLLANCGGGMSYMVMSGTSMATPHVAGILAQQMKRLQILGLQTSWTSLANVSYLRDLLICDSAPNKITGNPNTDPTTKTLLQIADYASNTACLNLINAQPTILPTQPPLSLSPVFAPTRSPSRSPSTVPTRVPTRTPTRYPTRVQTRKPTRK